MNNVACTYRVSVKALIKDINGRILLLREADGSWELPGGGLEHGESTLACITRELAEETGLRVTNISKTPIGFWTIYKEVGSPTLKWFAFALYQVEATGEIQLKNGDLEALEAKYFKLEDIKHLKLYANTEPYFSKT